MTTQIIKKYFKLFIGKVLIPRTHKQLSHLNKQTNLKQEKDLTSIFLKKVKSWKTAYEKMFIIIGH
jgi:hypothetical protein